MYFKPVFCILLFFSGASLAAGQTSPDTSSTPRSRLLRFAETGATDHDRSVLNVFVREEENGEPLLGATVLLQRQNPDQVHGKVSQWDGRCRFKVAPGAYTLRTQLTGMMTYEQKDIELEPGKQYEMELDMVRLGRPVPSAKSQAAKNR